MYHILDDYASADTHLRKTNYHILEVMFMNVKDMVAKRFTESCQRHNIKINELFLENGLPRVQKRPGQ